MPEQDHRIGLLKILIAAAWADGELSAPEQETIRRIERDLGLPEPQRAQLDSLLREPIGLEEAERMAGDLLPRLTREDREDWLRLIEQVVRSDERVDPAERRLLERMETAIRDADAGPSLLGRIRGFFRSERRADAGSERLERATLFGALLHRVAFADGDLSPEEAARLRTLLTGSFGFDDEESGRILQAIESKAAVDLDRQRLCAAFNRIADMEGRTRLLGCLFIVAEADGEIAEAELREMRLIANYLWIGARGFHEVRARYRRPGDAGGS